MSVPDRELLTNNFRTLIATGTGRPVGDHKAPADPVVPYHVLHVIPGGRFWGPPLSRPDECADFVYQIDSVSTRRDNAEWAADRARRTVLARTPSGAFQVAMTDPDGWKVVDRVPDGGAGGVEVDGEPPNQIYSIAERFVLRVVPA